MRFIPLFCVTTTCIVVSVASRAAPDEAIFNNQQLHQQTQQQAREKRLTPQAPDIRLQNELPVDASAPFPVESPCFDIQHVTLSGREAFPSWVPLQRVADGGVGQCLGIKGVNQLMTRVQNKLIGHGWVTSRVLAPAQDLRSGTLQLTLIPGKIRDVRYAKGSDSRAVLFTSMPARSGSLLDLRAIEQGLENQQRLPTVTTSMEIVPGDEPGESDIIITREQSRLWHGSVWLDDSGTVSTGRYQGGMMLALDNLLGLSDLFYISGSHDLDTHGDKTSKNLTGHYSLPLGFNLLELTASMSEYLQTVAGLNDDLEYSGKSKYVTAAMSRVLQRGSASTTTLRYGVLYRESHNFLNNTEIEVQQRRSSAWQLGLSHQHDIGAVSLDGGVSYQRGVRWFGALPAWESYRADEDSATDLSKILTLNASLNLPFTLGNQQFRYQLYYQRQTSNTPLTSPDQFSIGNRWTVRGFDGERSLRGTRGWYVQNTLAWRTPLPAQEWYLGVDYGDVGGYSSDYDLPGRHLAGGVTGLRGNIGNTGAGYDLFAGIPLSKPSGYVTNPVTLGFTLSWQF